MKRLNSKAMKKILRRGMREAKQAGKIINPDYCLCLFTVETKNGWYYQVDKTFDGTMVYAFKPPRVYYAKEADYYLRERK